MRSDLLTLEAALDEIVEIIQVHQLARDLHSQIASTRRADPALVKKAADIANRRTLQSQYHYVSVIIALYGAMEQYVEAILSSYTKLLPLICGRFDNIPEIIRIKHHDLTIEYLSAIKNNKIHEPEDVDVIVRRLANCRSRTVKYELNARAFALRTANMSFDRAKNLASNLSVNVSPRNLTKTASFAEFYAKRNGTAVPTMGDVEVKAEFSPIEGLVARRNRIAHGANSVDDIEDQNILTDRVSHLRMYCRALYEIFESHALRMCEKRKMGVLLGVPLHKYKGNIVCFKMEEGRIAVGDSLVMIPTDENLPARRGKVISLKMGATSFESIDGAPGCEFGAKLTFSPSQTAGYGVLAPEITSVLDS